MQAQLGLEAIYTNYDRYNPSTIEKGHLNSFRQISHGPEAERHQRSYTQITTGFMQDL